MSSLGCHPRHAASRRELETRNNQTSLRIKMDQLTFITRHLVINLFTGVKYHQASYIFCRMLLSLITFSRFDTRMQRGSQFARFFCEYKNSSRRAEKLSVMMTLVTSVCRGRRVATHWDSDPGTEAGPGYRLMSGRRRLQLRAAHNTPHPGLGRALPGVSRECEWDWVFVFMTVMFWAN